MDIKCITTVWDNDKAVSEQNICKTVNDPGIEANVANLYPEVHYQEFEGFGGAITEASGYTFLKMGHESRKEIIDAYFGTEGICYSAVRVPVDSCDFSLINYSAVNDESDVNLNSFNLERDKQYILPMLFKAQEAAGKRLKIMLSPWSPPAFMKTNGAKNGGGSLKPEYREMWARYLCRYVKEYRSMGLNVTMLTVQNEPKASQTWDSCIYTAQQEKEFIRDYLYPEMVKNGLEDLELCIWDHNKERVFERARDVIDADTDKMVKGVAFHWYSGDHFDAVRVVREKYPDKKLIFSEGCVEYSKFSAKDQLRSAQMYAHDILGNLNAGMNLSLDWNILLDERGGPNHVGNYCDAPLMANTKNDTVEKKLSYTYIGHFSRYIKPGAFRIASTVYTDRLETTAFRNPDGTIACVLLNRTESDLPVNLRICGQFAYMLIPRESITTLIITDKKI